MSTVQNYSSATSTLIPNELIIHYVRDGLVSGIVEAKYHDSASIASS